MKRTLTILVTAIFSLLVSPSQSTAQTSTTAAPCKDPTYSYVSVGTTAVACPTTELTSRRTVSICNSPRNAAGIVTIRIDGTVPTTAAASAGDSLRVGECVTYFYPKTPGKPIRCISDTAATMVTTLECR